MISGPGNVIWLGDSLDVLQKFIRREKFTQVIAAGYFYVPQPKIDKTPRVHFSGGRATPQ